MINTILFDLDGTLLPIDMDVFMKHYFQGICRKCSSLMKPKDLTDAIWASTEYMIRNLDGNKKNIEAFMEDFGGRVDGNLEELLEVIDEFYRIDFNDLKFTSKPTKIVNETIEILKEKGYDLVIATNPLFPRQAILHRIHWAGLNIDDFRLITDYETMHYCKPNIEFFKEILSIVGKDPLECIMVGNDVQEDLVAAKLGMKTFLIEDNIINRQNKEPNPDFRGNYEELLSFVKDLPNLKE